MSSRKIVLTSSDGETFITEEAVARQLQIVEQIIEEDFANEPIPLRNVTAEVLAKVIEYCKTQVDGAAEAEDEEAKKKLADSTEAEDAEAKKKHADSSEAKDEEAKKKLVVWDAEFMKNIDFDMVFKLILAANYLNVKGLLDLTCQEVADRIKDKSPDEVREIFNIENDFTPEEEATIRQENAWAFD